MASPTTVCRACLLPGDMNPLLDWHQPIDDYFEEISYSACFWHCTQLEVVEEQSRAHEQYLCCECAAELKATYKFIVKAQSSDRALRAKTGQLSLSGNASTEIESSAEFEWVAVQKEHLDANDNDAHVEELNLNIKEEPISPGHLNRLGTPTGVLSENDVDEEVQRDYTLDVTTAQKEIVEQKTAKESLSDTPTKTVSDKCDVLLDRSKKPVVGSIAEDERLVCEYCSKLFAKKQLKRHIARHHEYKMLLCHACPRTFKQPAALHKHALTHQENRVRNFHCEHCELKFYTHHSYLRHAVTHDPNRRPLFKCDQCEKSFFHKGSLKLHQRYHDGATVKCRLCGKHYVRAVDLEIHMRSHSGELPYKCNQCDRAFQVVHLLNRHIRQHEGFRYKCEICGKDYTHQATLIQHRREHIGMPLKCNLCGKEFVKKSKMRRHIGGVHKIKELEEIDKLIVRVKTKRTYKGRVVEDA